MPISLDFIRIVEDISNEVDIPLIKEIIVPKTNIDSKKTNFSAVLLEDSTIGLAYINLTPEIKKRFLNYDFSEFKNSSAISLARYFNSNDLFEKSLGLGTINAISQYFLKKVKFAFDFASDSLGLLNPKVDDYIGMVGYFPPLVKLIEKIGSKLIIIEKKEELIQETQAWSITLEPSKLKACNKVLITGTTILNDTLDEILQYCSNAEEVSIIGPTASFLPDAIFERGVNLLGGSFVLNPDYLIRSIEENIKWGKSVEKYIIQKKNYSGYKDLLSKIIK